MKLLLALGGLAVLAVVAQGTVLQGALFPGVTPDGALALTLLAARRRGAWGGTLLGLWGGLLTGALCGGLALPLGLSYALIGLLAGCYFESAEWTRPFEVACLVAALSLLLAAAQGLCLRWLGLDYEQAAPFILPGTAWNVLLLTPLLTLLR